LRTGWWEVVVTRAAVSVLAFGVYMLVMGVLLLAVPNVLLSLVRYPITDELWLRVLGVVTLILGYYYTVAARDELTSFFRASVIARPLLIVFFCTFVALGIAEPVLVLFGVVDLLGAIWTALALRYSQETI
jgi:hypothetical protein